jgi:AcrR family transcriptional regulator
MARLAAERDTSLTREEIAAEALRQFDANEAEPSIRSLAAALRVAPTTIYYHFPSRGAILLAAVELVWNDAMAEVLRLEPKPLEADPAELLVVCGIATRRAWLAHHRLAPYMAATPEANTVILASMRLMASIFSRLGLEGERAALAFHSYASFMIGAVLFAAERLGANEQLAQKQRGSAAGRLRRNASSRAKKPAELAIDDVMEVSIVDPQRDEELFALGLRRLIRSLVAD